MALVSNQHPMKQKIFLGLLLLMLSVEVIAQKDFIGVNSMAVPPFSNRIDELINNTNITTFLLNKTSNELQVKMYITIKKDGVPVIETNERYALENPLNFKPNENKLIEFSQFGAIREYHIKTLPEAEKMGLTAVDLIRTRKLPEGNYEVCLNFFDYKGQDPEPWNIPNVGCAGMELNSFEVPQIMDINGKNCHEKIQISNPQFVSISWLKPAGFTGNLEYEIDMVEVFPNNREFNDAIFSATKPNFLTERTNSTIFTINMVHQPLKAGARYVFRIRAIDPTGAASFRNNGYSQVCSFIYGDIAEDLPIANVSADMIFPQMNDTLPFQAPAFIKWSPYLQYIEKLDAHCVIKENNQQIHFYDISLDAQSGILNAIQNKNGGSQVSEDIATQIVLGKFARSGVANLLKRGKEYSYEIKLTYKFKNNPVTQTIDLTRYFYYGMPSVNLQLNTQQADTGNLSFSIAFNKKPNLTLNEFNQLNKLQGVYDFDSTLKIQEAAWVEFSPQASFDSVWYRKKIYLQKNIDISNPAMYLLADDIFKQIDFNFRIKESGQWHARVKWSKSPNSATLGNDYYYTSETLKFTLGDSVDRSGSDCLAGDCIFPPVPMNERIAHDSLVVGMQLKLGHHVVKVTKIIGNTAPYQGEGVIKINPFPLMGGVDIPIKVKFSNIRFKKDLRVFQGKAESIDGSGFFSDKTSSQIGNMLADSSYNKQNIKTLISNAANYVQGQISEEVGMPMPVGFADNKYAGTQYKLAIVNILFSPEDAKMNVVLGVNNASLGNYFDFMAQDVCLRSTGLSVSKMLVKAIGNKEINIGSSKKLVILGASNANQTMSYVEWDCNGFKNLHLMGYVEIDSTVLVQPKTGQQTNHSLVRANFSVNLKSWNDFIIDLGIDKPFEIAGLPKWTFEAGNLVLDLSNTKNPAGITFPQGYQGMMNNEWQGIFFKNIQVKTPVGFKDKTNESERLKFNIDNLIIDRTGVSTFIRTSNLLPLSKGKFDQWAISIGLIEIKVLSNAFEYGKIEGKLKVPIDESKEFGYTMVLDYLTAEDGKRALAYHTTLSSLNDLDFRMWKAKLSILPNSHAKFYYNSNDSVYAELKINGTMSIVDTFPLIKKIDFAGIRVENLVVRSSNVATSDSSFINIDKISFASAQKTAGGFPVNFKDFKVVKKNEIINGKNTQLLGLEIEMDVNLKMGANSFAGGTKLDIWAKPDKKEGILGFKYHDFSVDSIGINGKIAMLEVEGYVKFYDNDPVYGDGLKGNLMAQFTPGISLGALAYFGNVTQSNKKFDYWGVFGSVTLSSGIPILAAFEVAGFGGGAYNNMEMMLPQSPMTTREVKLNSASLIPVLKPKFDVFGFRATVFAQSFPGGTSWKAALSLGAEIKKSDFSLQNINFQGNMWMMAPSPKPGEPALSSFWAEALINYDFVNEQFDGSFNFFANKEIAPSITMQGIQNNDRAGTILMHYSKQKWFVYAGKPDDRCGIKLNNPAVSLNGYLVMGSVVPGIPPLPTKILNVISPTVSTTRSPEISQGKGFGFGAEFGINTGDKKFLFMTASLDLLVGFDMSLMKYEQASCDGISMNNIGIDGWYGRGQLYAYAEGKIYADIDVWFYTGKVEIMNCKAGMALEGGLPNPTWLKGSIAGNYSLFNGSLKGNFKYDALIGKECRPAMLQESPVVDMKIIADVTPSDQSNNYSIFDKPEILCNLEINKEISFEVIDNNGVKRTRTFRPKLSITLKEGNSNVSIYTQSYKADDFEKLTLNLNGGAAFKPVQAYILELTEFFEEKVNGNWVLAKDKNNQAVRSIRTIKFTTGSVPSTIPENVITEMTPAMRENNFMKINYSENGQESMISYHARFTHNLKQYYFLDSIVAFNANYFMVKVKARYVVRFTNLSNPSDILEQEGSVNSAGTLFSCAQSGNLGALKAGTMYKVEMIRKPVMPQHSMQALVVSNFYTTQMVNKINNANFNLNTKNIKFSNSYKNSSASSNEFVLFTAYFRTSQYNKLENKVQESKLVLNLQRPDQVITYIIDNAKGEGFDEAEWNKKVWLKDVIRSGVNWYKAWDSVKMAMTYINDYKTFTIGVLGSNISMSRTINSDINTLKLANYQFRNESLPMWNVMPFTTATLVKNTATNDAFLNLNRNYQVQVMASDFDKQLNLDRTKIKNNIIEVLALQNQMKAYCTQYNINFNQIPTGPSKRMPDAVKNYLSAYLAGSFVPRKTDGGNYHQIWWYYQRPFFDTKKREINNYQINSSINR